MEINETMFQNYGLSESDLSLVMSCFVPLNLRSNDYFLKQGIISDKIGFVKAGVLRAYFYDDNADEVTTQFYQTGSLVISVDSFNNQLASKENIIAVGNSDLFVISYTKLKGVYQAVPVWQQICKDIADIKSNELISRSVEFQTLSAAERYRQFCLQNPEVTRCTALRHIASYLGIDIATLSRIRKKR